MGDLVWGKKVYFQKVKKSWGPYFFFLKNEKKKMFHTQEKKLIKFNVNF